MELPDLPPYAPENEGLATPPPGQVLHKFPQDVKYMNDPFWYDTLGRTLIEQRKVLTVPRSGEEQVAMVEEALKDARDADDEGEADETEEDREETFNRRIESIALEAAMKDSAAVMKHLVAKYGLNAEKNTDGLMFETHIASRDGSIQALEVLFDQAGVDVDVKDSEEITPLCMAAHGDQAEVVRFLLGRGAQLERPVFHAAAASGNVEMMRTLLAAAQDKEPGTPISTWLTEENFLGSAAQSASEDMMLLIAETAGLGPAASNTAEMRKVALKAIPSAIRNDKTNQQCVDLAVGYTLPKNDDGSFVKTDDSDVIEALSNAAMNSCARVKPNDLEKMLQLLLDATTFTADSTAFKSIVDEILHWCRTPRAEPCARKLLEEWGASPNTNDSTHSREAYAILLAQSGVDSCNRDYLKFWLKHGADIHRAYGKYCNGPTALVRAVETQQEELVKELLEWGGPVDRIESGLATRKKIWLVISDDELKTVELVASTTEEAESRGIELTFKKEITADWLHKIQLRRSDAELAEDGSGRPLKTRD